MDEPIDLRSDIVRLLTHLNVTRAECEPWQRSTIEQRLLHASGAPMIRMCAIAVVTMLGAALAHAQAPPQVNPKTHPHLAAMQAWLQNGSQEARYCALSGGLFLEAVDLYRSTQSETATNDAMMRAHGEKLAGPERDRLRTTVSSLVLLASGLSRFDRDSAAVAYTQLCIGRAQRPQQQAPQQVVSAQLQAAQRCEQRFAAGSLDRKECVAAAFRLAE
jgi:hypothetical protein